MYIKGLVDSDLEKWGKAISFWRSYFIREFCNFWHYSRTSIICSFWII